MPTTRSAKNSTSPASATKTNGKRAAETASSPSPRKRGKTSKSDKAGDQKTIEETMDGIESVEDDHEVAKQINDNGADQEQNNDKDDDKKEDDLKAREDAVKAREDAISKKEGESHGKSVAQQDASRTEGGAKNHETDEKAEAPKSHEKNAFDEVKSDEGDVKREANKEEAKMTQEITNNGDSVVTDEKREAAMPSSILEKGIIYFFFRGRVGVEDAQGIEDIARSYIILRPLPIGAKLGQGPLEDAGNARLLALPKKVLPKSHRDRFLMFVEKHHVSIKDLKEEFIAGSEYATKTSGTSNVPAATPFAEGVYAITSTGRESHLAYHITVPEIGELQKEIGLNEKGSFVLSVKNPTAPGPANATLDKGAQYPESIMSKFRGLRWTPLEPEMLDYDSTQFLIIGEGLGSVDKAMEEQPKDKKNDEKETPMQELEKLEEEDNERVEGLKGDDAVFADLGLSSKEYPKMETTW